MTDRPFGPPGPPDEPPLELADVPRRPRPVTAPGTLHTPGAHPVGPGPSMGGGPSLAGGTSVAGGTAVASRGGGRGVQVGLVIAAAVLAVLAGMGYQRCNRSDVVSIRSPHKSRIGLTFDLPAGGGWKVDRRLSQTREQAGAWMRTEAMFRGRSASDPTDLLLAFRVHAENAFPAQVDLNVLRRYAEQITEAMRAMGTFAATGISCGADQRVRTEPAARCVGTATILGQVFTVGVYVWQPNTEDLVGLFYVSQAVDDGSFDAVVASAR